MDLDSLDSECRPEPAPNRRRNRCMNRRYYGLGVERRQIEVDWVALAVTGITTPMSRTRDRVSANASHVSVAWAPGGPRLPARAIASAEV
jgi:hypothetical protein